MGQQPVLASEPVTHGSRKAVTYYVPILAPGTLLYWPKLNQLQVLCAWFARRSADGDLLISSGDDATLKIWSLSQNKCQTLHSVSSLHSKPQYPCAQRPTGTVFTAGGGSKCVCVAVPTRRGTKLGCRVCASCRTVGTASWFRVAQTNRSDTQYTVTHTHTHTQGTNTENTTA